MRREAEQSSELVGDFAVSGCGSIGSGNDDQIEGRMDEVVVFSEELTNLPPDAIALWRIPDLAAGGDSQTRGSGGEGSCENDEARPGLSPTPILQGNEIRALPNVQSFGKPLVPNRLEVVAHPGCFGGIETVRRLRPLARRRAKMARPAAVAMRLRKPCLRKRLRLLGLKVGCIGGPQQSGVLPVRDAERARKIFRSASSHHISRVMSI